MSGLWVEKKRWWAVRLKKAGKTLRFFPQSPLLQTRSSPCNLQANLASKNSIAGICACTFFVADASLSQGCQNTSPFGMAMPSAPRMQNTRVPSGTCAEARLPSATAASTLVALPATRSSADSSSSSALRTLLWCLVGSGLGAPQLSGSLLRGALSHSRWAHGTWQGPCSTSGEKASWQHTFSVSYSPSPQVRVSLCWMFSHQVRLKALCWRAAMKLDEKPPDARSQGPLAPAAEISESL
mmetsp:Transcript_22341/g.59547  ORF Transcript_22341/g.59547 Transcript_22341/m.59547 type:complete len:240 (-) Transcript_22341:344-1063(-)